MRPTHLGCFVGCLMLWALTACGGGGSDDDDTVSGSNNIPVATISSPSSGAHLPLDSASILTGQVSDVETQVQSLAVTWRSDMEGSLGESTPDSSGGVTLSYSFQVAGPQIITLTVTDTEGESDSVTVSVLVDEPPEVEILAVDPDPPVQGEDATFTAIAEDNEDDARNLTIRWSDDRGNVLGTDPAQKDGTVQLTTDRLTERTRSVTLTVTDAANQQSSDTFSLDVIVCTDADSDGWTDCDGDCDDEDPDSYPQAEEICDGKDQDCNGINDNGFPDADGDKIMDCIDVEECDGVDNDGDGQIDEGMPDTDGDGIYDCFDEEECDGMDNDGNGEIDDGFPDQDEDGLADCVDTCLEDPDNDVDLDGVCGNDDNCPYVSNIEQFDADEDGLGDVCDPELCNGVDDNGNGEIDEDLDWDEDGISQCDDDCNDQNPEVYPDADEVCDGVDNDCNELVDEDEYEPNDNLDDAYFLGDLNGEDSFVSYDFYGTIGTNSDTDYYRISLVDDFAFGADEFELVVTLSDIPAGADYDLYLYWDDPDDVFFTGIQQIQASGSSGNQDEYIREYGDSGPDNGGNYWIEVRQKSGSSCEDYYMLTIENKG